MISAYMKDDITIKRISFDTWGAGKESTVASKGYFTFKTKLVRSTTGEQVVSSANVILPIMTLGHQDKITYDGKDYSILAIELRKDFSNRFLLAYLG